MSDVQSVSSKLCSIDGCGRPYYARGWCQRHYGRWWKNGDPGPVGLIQRTHLTQHGTYNEYHNYGCRCEPCKKAASEWQRKYKGVPCEGCGKTIYARFRKSLCRACRAAARTIPLEQLHGTVTGYSRGCRCLECRDASAAAKRRWRAANPEREREYQRRKRWAKRTPLQKATSRLSEEMAA